MALQKNFLTDSFDAVRTKLSAMSEPVTPDGREVDSRYREQAAQNLKQGEKHFMWGEASKILTMMMSAVLMGGVTGTAVNMLANAGVVGMAALGLGGIALAGAALGAAYLSFKSQGKNWMNVNETNAELGARKIQQELTPALSKAIAVEIGAGVRTAIKDTVKELRAENQVMLAGTAHTNGSVDAGIGKAPLSLEKAPLSLEKEFAARVANDDVKPVLLITETPSNITKASEPIAYSGKMQDGEKVLEAASVR